MSNLSQTLGTGTYEQNVYIVLKACLSDNESVTLHSQFDFYAPNGIRLLNWPPKTAVEVKYRLIYDTLSKVRFQYDNKNNDVEQLVVIFFESLSPFSLQLCNHRIVGRSIQITSYDDLYDKAGKPNLKENNAFNLINKEFRDKTFVLAKEAFRNNKISLFLGAGVSASAGVVTWVNLLEQLCVKHNISRIDSEIDEIIKGRIIVDEYNDGDKLSSEFYEDMKEILYSNLYSRRPLIKSIANLIIKAPQLESVISYNYDNLVEQEVSKKIPCSPIYDKSRNDDAKTIQVYHVHGFISQEERKNHSHIVLGEKEYHKIYQEAYNWGNVEQLHALCRSTCFFIGLSMKDPNLRRLLDISIEAGSEIEPTHYVFLREIEYNVPIMEKIMRSFGILCIWYKQYSDLPKLLNELMDDN